jgi:hypothetical protein
VTRHDFITRSDVGVINVKAAELYVRTNKDPIRGSIEIVSGDVTAQLPCLQYDNGVDWEAYWFFPMPPDYSGGDLRLQTLYYINSGQVNGEFNWSFAVRGFGNNSIMDKNFPAPTFHKTPVLSTDYHKLKIIDFDETENGCVLTPNGTVGPGCMMCLQLKRNDVSGVSVPYPYPVFFFNSVLTFDY